MSTAYRYLITVAGELPIKSWRSRPKFYKVLLRNIGELLRRKGALTYSSKLINAKIFLESDVSVLEELSRVFGVMKVAEVEVIDFNSLEDLVRRAGELSVELVLNRKFAVRVKRSGTHDFTSLDVARELGAYLRPRSAGVDLEEPEVEVILEVRDSRAYLYRRLVEGVGGFPIGTEGRSLAMFSGGMDSPVAAWLTAKRGVRVDYLHFFMGSPRSTRLAFTVAKTLTSGWFHGHSPRFYVADLTEVLTQIRERVRWEFRQVVLRTIMYIIGARVALRNGYEALVTGESIGQASSQTLTNMSAAQAVANVSIPILRPLISFDKDEIVKLARTIGTYELSSKVGEPCAIAPSRVRTRVSVGELRNEVGKISGELIDKVSESVKVVDVINSVPEEALPDSLVVIDYIPEDAVVVDLRDKDEYVEWHYPGALHYEDIDINTLKERTLVLYCWRGNVSYIEASRLRAKGFKVYSFSEGVEGLRRILGVYSKTSCERRDDPRSRP
ncbi:MAG: THUMP domain-containing protein [Zestosphaera sp.]